MEKILDFIYTKNSSEFSDLQFFGAKFLSNDNLLQVTFSSPISDSYVGEKLELLNNIVNEYIEKKCKTCVKVKQKIITTDYILTLVKKFLMSNKLYNTVFDVDKTIIEVVDKSLNVKLYYYSSLPSKLEMEDFALQMENTLACCSFNSINYSYEQIQNQNSNILDFRRQDFMEDDFEQNTNIEVSFVKPYLGKMPEYSTVILPEQVVGGTKNIAIAGEFFDYSEFVRNKEVDGEQKQSKYYKFSLHSQETQLEAVCFLKNGEDLKNLKNGQKVLVFADIDEFRGNLSLRVRALALCKFDYPKKQLKKASSHYKIVKPEPYIQMEQINFLDTSNEIKSEYLKNNTFVVFDLETTGLNYQTCKIIEIGAVKVVNGRITELFSTFVNPEMHIPEDATATNNITDEMVKDAPVFKQVFPDFFKFIDGSTLVAHNISFDLPFISYHAKPLGYVIDNPTQDTMILAQKYLGQLKHFKLSTVCDFLGVSLIGAHRAVNDTIATAKVFVKLIENYQDKK